MKEPLNLPKASRNGHVRPRNRRYKAVALLFDGDLLVDGDRCTPLVCGEEWLIPSEADSLGALNQQAGGDL